MGRLYSLTFTMLVFLIAHPKDVMEWYEVKLHCLFTESAFQKFRRGIYRLTACISVRICTSTIEEPFCRGDHVQRPVSCHCEFGGWMYETGPAERNIFMGACQWCRTLSPLWYARSTWHKSAYDWSLDEDMQYLYVSSWTISLKSIVKNEARHKLQWWDNPCSWIYFFAAARGCSHKSSHKSQPDVHGLAPACVDCSQIFVGRTLQYSR